jgi:hypothetical protein
MTDRLNAALEGRYRIECELGCPAPRAEVRAFVERLAHP